MTIAALTLSPGERENKPETLEQLRRLAFLDGEAAGNPQIAKVLAIALGKHLVRLQCYEGRNVGSAAYEWNCSRQIFGIRLAPSSGQNDRGIFMARFLLKRPIRGARAGGWCAAGPRHR